MKVKLSKSEELLMSFLWELNEAYMKDLVEMYDDPKPASTTIATLLKRMYDKKYIDYKKIGSSRLYVPLVKKSEYVSGHLNNVMDTFFGNSKTQFASFFTKQSKMSVDELEELKKIIDEQIETKKQ